ncbi:hypothetical protein ABK040_003373 [Willaertia magna]
MNVYCAGSRSSHQIPKCLNDEKDQSIFLPLDPSIFDFDLIKIVACGYSCSFFLTESNHLFCCGQNSHGQLGIGTSSPQQSVLLKDKVKISNYSDIEKIYSGDTFSFFILKDGTLLRCGRNGLEGYIGAEGLEEIHTPEALKNPVWNNAKVEKVAYGYYHSIVLTDEGKIYGTGQNSRKQLGLKDSEVYTAYQSLKINDFCNEKIKDIACGVFHSLCVTKDGNLYGCGADSNNELGEPMLEWTKIRSGISKIFCGSLGSMALTVSDELYICGDNGSFELGVNKESKSSKWSKHNTLSGIGLETIGYYTYQSIFITKSGKVFVAGNNHSCQLGIKATESTVVLQRNKILEEAMMKHYDCEPHVTGGFQHMIVYFTKSLGRNMESYMKNNLHDIKCKVNLSDIKIKWS